MSQRGQARSPSCEHAERVVLANGIELLLVAEPEASSLAVVSSVHAGTRHDPPEHEGLAHFVQDLALRKTPTFPSSLTLYREAGAFELNASARRDTTDFYALLPAAQLERALWLEARRLAVGLDAQDEQAALQERAGLLREHAWRFGSGTRQLQLQTLEESLFGEQHPYHVPLETERSLSRLTLADARAFFARYYQPDRVRVVLLGGFDVAQAKALSERYLGAVPAAASSQAQALSERECAAARAAPALKSAHLVLSSPSPHEALEMYWPLAAEEDPEHWRGLMAMLESALSDAAEQAGISNEVGISLEQRELGAYWKLQLSLQPGQKFERAEALVRLILKDLSEHHPDPGSTLARRQAFELSEALAANDLLGRALSLARRECSPSSCASVSEPVDPALFAQLQRFAPERALILERRFRINAPYAGSIERVR